MLQTGAVELLISHLRLQKSVIAQPSLPIGLRFGIPKCITMKTAISLRNKEVLDQLNKVYAEAPSLQERRTVAGMKKRFRSTILGKRADAPDNMLNNATAPEHVK